MRNVLPDLFCHIEALGRLWQARLELVVSTWRAAIERVDPPSLRCSDADTSAPQTVRAVERALYRASRLAPGATCIHRALAARRMLAVRGIDARVVIGLRKRSRDLQGHAWIEADCGEDRVRAFADDGDDYVRASGLSNLA